MTRDITSRENQKSSHLPHLSTSFLFTKPVVTHYGKDVRFFIETVEREVSFLFPAPGGSIHVFPKENATTKSCIEKMSV